MSSSCEPVIPTVTGSSLRRPADDGGSICRSSGVASRDQRQAPDSCPRRPAAAAHGPAAPVLLRSVPDPRLKGAAALLARLHGRTRHTLDLDLHREEVGAGRRGGCPTRGSRARSRLRPRPPRADWRCAPARGGLARRLGRAPGGPAAPYVLPPSTATRIVQPVRLRVRFPRAAGAAEWLRLDVGDRY